MIFNLRLFLNRRGAGGFFPRHNKLLRMMIGYLDNKKFSVNNICKDNNAKILIIKAEIETETFILVNLCNSNSDTEQLSDADLLLSDFSLDNKKTIDFAGDFNLFFNQKIEVASKHPVLKKRTI